jgi:hypothetical protein
LNVGNISSIIIAVAALTTAISGLITAIKAKGKAETVKTHVDNNLAPQVSQLVDSIEKVEQIVKNGK